MARGLQAVKRRIQSVGATKKITKAMELVATAKLKSWKDKMLETANYTQAMQDLVSQVFAKTDGKVQSVFLQKGNATKKLYIVVTSTLGFCAGYNYNIFKLADQWIKEEDDILLIGSKGYYHYRNHEGELIQEYLDVANQFDYAHIQKLANRLMSDFKAQKYESIEFIHTRYVNSLTFEPEKLTLLPVRMEEKTFDSKHVILEPNAKAIMQELIPLYVRSLLYGKMIESMVSEQASRRTAMENATNNAEEITDQLLLEYNKQRQAAITQEITEVVGGAQDK